MAFTILLIIFIPMIIENTNSETVGCNGDCQCMSNYSFNEACRLNCGFQDSCKASTLTCATGRPCIVLCQDISSCADLTTIHGLAATDVTVICSTVDACKSQLTVTCGTGNCKIQCNDPTACEDMAIPITINANSFQCTNCPSNIAARTFTANPTEYPTISPTNSSQNPTTISSKSPTNIPTQITLNPSNFHTETPTNNPSITSTYNPNNNPSLSPNNNSTFVPTFEPTIEPTYIPTIEPTSYPSTISPTKYPSDTPTIEPTTITTDMIVINTKDINNLFVKNEKKDNVFIVLVIVISIILCIGLIGFGVKIYLYKNNKPYVPTPISDDARKAVFQGNFIWEKKEENEGEERGPDKYYNHFGRNNERGSEEKIDAFEITLIQRPSISSTTVEIKPQVQTETGARKSNEMQPKVGCSTPPMILI